MPVYNPEPDFLRAAVDSLLAQEYPHWELCMADDASTDPAAEDLLRQLAARDHRIRLAFRQENGHISEATNTALEMARHPYSALMDQDDMLRQDALAKVAEAAAAHPEAEVFYSDEVIMLEGRSDICPYCKPDWDQDLLYGQNYVSHLGVYLTRRLREIGGFRRGFEGSQDYDMLLRYSLGLDAQKIRRLPHALYLWRSHAGSVASGSSVKPYALVNGRKALEEHLAAAGIEASVHNCGAFYHVRHKPPSPMPLVSFIIDCGDAPSESLRLLKILSSLPDYPKVQILLSHDETLAPNEASAIGHLSQGWPRARFLAFPSSAGEAERANTAAKNALGSVLVFLRAGLLPAPWSREWLSVLAGHVSRSGMGAVGGRIVCENGDIYFAGYQTDAKGALFSLFRGLPGNSSYFFAQAALARGVSALHPHYFAASAKHFAALGGFRENTGGAPAIEYCLRLHEAGLGVAITPLADFVMKDALHTPWENEGRVSDPALLSSLAGRLHPYHPRLAAHGTLWAYIDPDTGAECPLAV